MPDLGLFFIIVACYLVTAYCLANIYFIKGYRIGVKYGYTIGAKEVVITLDHLKIIDISTLPQQLEKVKLEDK